jgi:hypothetical protein
VRAACRHFPEGSLLPFSGGFGRRVELNPENRDEVEQKGKETKRTTGNSKPIHLRGGAIRGTFFYGSALLCVLCTLLFHFGSFSASNSPGR